MLLGLLLAFATSIAWVFGNVFIQRAGRAVGDARALLWNLVLGGLVSALAIPFFDRRSAGVDAAALGWLLTAGVATLSAYACLFYAFARSELSLAVPFVSCWSLVAGLIGLVVLGERPQALKVAGAAVVFGGVLLVSVGATRAGARQRAAAGGAGPRRGRSPLPALAAGVSFGTLFPALAQAAPAFGTFGAATLAYAIALVLGVPLALIYRLDLSWPPRSSWPLLLGTGTFEVAGFILLTSAGLLAPFSVVAPVASLSSAITVLYAFFFLGERPGRLALLGALLASVGVVVLSA